MFWRALRSVAILPGMVVVLMPAGILWVFRDTHRAHNVAPASSASFWSGIVLALCGVAMIAWTVSLFAGIGRGTLAPWEPPKHLVVRGPYRHVRNPMISGVLAALLGEAIFFQSWPLAAWFLVFFAGNAIYFPLVEEPGLQRRFGEEYTLYRRYVPRWVPRLRPWDLTPTPNKP